MPERNFNSKPFTPDRKFVNTKTPIGQSSFLEFSTEEIPGCALLDTQVSIDGQPLCWITYPDKEVFTEELKAVIEKYQI